MKLAISNIIIDPANNARSDLPGIKELSQSIKRNGLMTAVTVRDRGDGKFDLIAGYRRMAALAELKATEVEAVVMPKEYANSRVANLVENIERKSLSSHDLAVAVTDLHDKKMTYKEISHFLVTSGAEAKGLSEASLGNLARILRVLDPRIVAAWKEGNEYATISNLIAIADGDEDQWHTWQVLTGDAEPDAEDDDDSDDDAPEKKDRLKTRIQIADMIVALKDATAPEQAKNAAIESLRWVLKPTSKSILGTGLKEKAKPKKGQKDAPKPPRVASSK